MLMTDTDTLMFFEGHSAALPIFLEFERFLDTALPVVNKRVRKTQISFFNRHVFACVSFAAVRRKADLPEGYIVITLCLPYCLDSDRAAMKVEAYPGRGRTISSSAARMSWTMNFKALCAKPTTSRIANDLYPSVLKSINARINGCVHRDVLCPAGGTEPHKKGFVPFFNIINVK